MTTVLRFGLAPIPGPPTRWRLVAIDDGVPEPTERTWDDRDAARAELRAEGIDIGAAWGATATVVIDLDDATPGDLT